MTNLNNEIAAMKDMLHSAKVIAVVGHSEKPHRTSYRIAQFLREAGYKVYPVNPTVSQIDGERSYVSLSEVPEPIDIVNVFRRSKYISDILDESIMIGAKSIWTQLGVVDTDAAQRALDSGLGVVMDRCIKVEYLRLEIG